MCCAVIGDVSLSLPTRGAWIEMWMNLSLMVKTIVAPHAGSVDRNHSFVNNYFAKILSLPTRGAWIEISQRITVLFGATGSLPTRGAWIEMSKVADMNATAASLPTRGAWIEIRQSLDSPLFGSGRSPRGERG